MGLFNLFKPAKTVLVVDVVSLNESLGMKGKVPPRSQLQMLRRLARFSQREKIEVIAVMSGTPLNKAPAGKKFEDISIVYTKSLESHAKEMARIAQGKGAGAILVSGNAAVEKIAGNGVKKMRVSTFRKAFDVGGEGEGSGGNSGGGENNRNRGNRQRRDRPRRKPEGNDNKRDNKRDGKRDSKPKEVSEADAINELIDLVD